MEWREQTAVGCEVAFREAQRWIEEVTKKRFGSSNFRSALENGVLLCDLINKLKPGIIKRVNRLSTPIAGLDNVNVFLKACGKLGLNDAQLFHPGDLQDVSTRVTVRRQETSRRLKNVLITIYWLGRKAQADPSYSGPQLNFKAFEGLLGVALSKALEEASCSKSSVRDSGFAETWYPDREVPSYRREDSVESLDSVESHTLSVASDCTLIAGSEGFGSDAEAEHCFRMTEPLSASGTERRNLPAALRKKRFVQHEEGGRGRVSPLHSENGRGLDSPSLDLPPVSAFHQWAHDYQSDSESDSDRPEPDLVQDDLASRRFRSATPNTPTNFAVPLNPRSMRPFPAVSPSARRSWVTMSDASRLAAGPHEMSSQSSTPPLPSSMDSGDGYRKSTLEDELLLRAWNEESSESDEGQGFADPVQDDLYARRVLQATHQTSVNTDSDKFLPKYWTPEEDAHVGRIRLGSQRRPWYKKMQGFRSKSMSDITPEPVAQEAESSTSFHPLKSQRGKAATVSLRQERIRQYQARLRESEAKWQEDLTRWKTRRRSVNSDLHRKKDEQEQLGFMSSGTVPVGGEQEQSFCRRSLQREETDLASTATDEAFTPSPLTSSSSSSMPGPINTTGPAPVHRGCSHANDTIEASHHTPPVVSAASDHVQSSSSPFLPASDTDSAPVPVSRAKSLEGVFPGTPQMSAALPRGFRRSEGTSRLSTGVTPKPFSTKTSRMSTQPRFYSMDDSHSGQRERHQLPASFPHRGIDTTPDYKDDTRSSTHEAVQWRKKKEEERGKQMDSAPSIHSFMSASVLIPDKAVCVSREDEVDHRDMQVSLNQTPNSGTDFGFQARWDSTGARIKSVQPGSPAHLCHLHAGDEIVALGGQRVAEMSYEKWKANMDAALREGKLLMDIRRLSLNGHPDHHAPISNTSSLPMENESNAQVNGHPVNGLPSKAMHRSFHDNPVAIKNKGGSESAISDLQVPSIGASSSCRSWNAEEERRKQEKWQMEQEHLLQEKYRRDQERLEEAWRRDQQEAALEENSNTEKQDVPSFPTGNIMHYTPPPFLHRSNSPTFVALTQQAQEAALVQNKQVQIAAGHPTKDECDSSSKTSQWPSESYGFTKLTASDRKKSKSTPSLDGSHKQDSRVGVKKKGRLSQAEQERQQILEEMRKKTPVLTDSSWIRQRHTCTIHKEPVNVAPLRRHESLDNIRSSSSSGSSSKQFSSSSQPLSGLSGIIPYRGYSGRCSLGPGAAIFSNALKQSSWSRPTSISPVSDEEACNRPQQCDRLASRRRPCSRCEQPLVKGPAMVIESLELCFHVGCFKCVSCRAELRRDPESRAQVRVRHGQLFCDTCYNRLRVRTGIPK
ncbi:LIM domain only protein 7b isoform X4 [Pangasianodon hypophthalmus]|uniref:LIM domain only protein 7b isoform X4 n=1 Tax=Pangasianodon hypophthalmus TaxID=310915 RepID=UPI002306DD8F|nr:LIM domain only protein 7b isoform X4 [Pangasianodon hypophthalmus]